MEAKAAAAASVGGSAAPSVLDAPLSKGKSEVSLSAFALVFSELVQYCRGRTNDMEHMLSDLGFAVGLRCLELLSFRENKGKKERAIRPILQFVRSVVWKALFGKAAERLERSTRDESEYYIVDEDLLVTRFISTPNDLACAAYVSGLVAGVLEGAGFPARVAAHLSEAGAAAKTPIVFVVHFEPHVVERDKEVQ